MTWSTRRIYHTALSVSLAAHVAVVGVCALDGAQDDMAAPSPAKVESIVAFNISAPQSKGVPLDEPVADAEAVTKTAVPKPVDGTEADEAGATSGDGMVWTPPPPLRNALPLDVQEPEAPPEAPVINALSLPGERSEPVLVSFSSSVSSDGSIAAEVERLGGAGRIKLSVEIDDEGVPLGCSVLESSGSNLLDTHGCEVVLEYRYEPAKDSLGRAAYGRAFEYLEWGSSEALDRIPDPVSLADVAL